MDARTGSACQSGAREDRARQLSSATHSCFAHVLGLLTTRHVPSCFSNLFTLGLCVHRITASSHCGRNCSLRFHCIADTMSVSFPVINCVYFYFLFRVLLERLIVNRPHPWGLLITFIELIKNHQYKFWTHEFVHCAPEIEK